jgi:hypothetical protein
MATPHYEILNTKQYSRYTSLVVNVIEAVKCFKNISKKSDRKLILAV